MKIFDISKTRFISHRGFTPLAPENSLPSFYYAGLLGQWAIETDLHVTQDGEIVCCHNETVDQYCNGSGKISEMSCRELRRLEIIRGNRVECLTPEERRIPRLSEYLTVCRRFGSIPFIELKTDDAEYVIYHLRKNGFADDEVVMSSTKLEHLIDTRHCAPDMFMHWIFAEENRLPELHELGYAGFSLKIADPFACDTEKITQAHQMGLKICLRAADNAAGLARMKELGLDYFPTNNMHDKR
ncbi:MAG: hypothetical protein IKL84_02110 [Clostridia bacterium]|nr:hypothetical protein [Clostridia bacterium]